MSGYAWYLKLQDLVSGPAAKLAARYRTAFDRVSQANARFRSENRQGGQSIDGLRAKIESLRKYRDGLDIRVNIRGIREANAEIGRLEGQLSRLEGRGRGAGAPGGQGGGGMGMLAGLGRFALPALLGGSLLTGAGALARNVMDREQLQLQFGLFTKSQAKGNELYGQLNRYADVTPFSNDEILNSGRNLLSMGFGAERVMPLLEKLGNVAAGLKIPFEELTGVFGKMSQKGFADTSDLYQFTDRGIPIMEYLGKVLKKSNAELFKMAEKRQLKFEYIEEAFTRMSAKGGLFEGMLDKMANTMGGKWSTIMGTAKTQITDFGAQFEGSLNRGLDALVEFQKHTPGVLTSLANLTKGLQGIGGELVKLFSFGSKGGFMGGLAQVIDNLAMFATNIQANMAWVGGGESWQHRVAAIRRNRGEEAANKFFTEWVVTNKWDLYARNEARKQVMDPARQAYAEKYLPKSEAYRKRQEYEQAVKQKQALDAFIKANTKGQKLTGGGSADGGGGAGTGISRASGLSETVGAVKSQTINVTIQTLKAAEQIVIRKEEGVEPAQAEAMFQDMMIRMFSGIGRLAPL